MTKKTNTKRIVSIGKSHEHLSLLDLLKEHSGERTSKLEAYLNLVDLASAQYVPKELHKEDYDLQSNQFVTTITELADCWHWHRATVRTFIEQLEASGQISVTRLARSQIITVNASCGERATISNGEDKSAFIQKLNDVLSDWVNGGMTAKHCSTLCEQLYADAVSETATKEFIGSKGNVSDTEKMNAELCRTALRYICVATFQKIIGGTYADTSASNGSPLFDFFYNDLGGDWESFIKAAKALSELVIDGESPSLSKDNAAVRSQFCSLCRPFLTVLTSCNSLS